jgi:hypothetical protein
MPRSSSYDPNCTINFQTTERTRDRLHALARAQDRSASSLIRMAVGNLLAAQPPPAPAQQPDGEDSTVTA